MMLPSPSQHFRVHLAERVLWTAIQAGLAVVTVESFQMSPVYVPILATALAFIKGQVARHVGDLNSPAMLPAGA